jgi:hypothetical protein
MADGFEFDRGAGCIGADWSAVLAKWIGTTVTIFTSSGGESGSGFTGVLMCVNPVFVRLLTRIGPPPGCSIGNSCTGFGAVPGYGHGFCGGCGAGRFDGAGFGFSPVLPANVNGAAAAGGWDAMPVSTVGSVADIPVSSIVSFVHHAV